MSPKWSHREARSLTFSATAVKAMTSWLSFFSSSLAVSTRALVSARHSSTRLQFREVRLRHDAFLDQCFAGEVDPQPDPSCFSVQIARISGRGNAESWRESKNTGKIERRFAAAGILIRLFRFFDSPHRRGSSRACWNGRQSISRGCERDVGPAGNRASKVHQPFRFQIASLTKSFVPGRRSPDCMRTGRKR